MSLIFSALKTMEDAEAGAPDLLAPAPQPRRLGWLHLLGAIGVISIVAGGVGFWRMTSSEGPAPVMTEIASAPDTKTTVASAESTRHEEVTALPAPSKRSAHRTEPETTTVSTPQLTMTLTKMPKLAAMPSHSAEPPVSERMPSKLAAKPSVPVHPVVVSAPMPTRIAVKAPPKLVRVDTTAISSAPARATSQKPQEASVQPVAKPMRVALVEQAAQANPVPVDQAQDATPAQSDPAVVAAANKEIVARRQLSFHVSMLMSDFRAAIAAGNASKAKQKLGALEQIASPDSLTLLRARAYWALTQGQMDQAMDRYRSILQRVPADRDAMLNLAVAEWQGGQKSDALARIETLAKRFPDDLTVQRYQQVMEGR